jgi:hypothetical protein
MKGFRVGDVDSFAPGVREPQHLQALDAARHKQQRMVFLAEAAGDSFPDARTGTGDGDEWLHGSSG